MHDWDFNTISFVERARWLTCMRLVAKGLLHQPRVGQHLVHRRAELGIQRQQLPQQLP